MTRGSMGEYTEAVRGRYLRASKKEKGRILDEFTKVVGCQRSKGSNHPEHISSFTMLVEPRVSTTGKCLSYTM